MEENDKHKDKRRLAGIVVLIVMALALILAFTSATSNDEAEVTIEKINTMYLEELSSQTIAYLDAGKDSKIDQMDAIATALRYMDVDEDGLKDYIAEQKRESGFETFYLVDEQGRCF